MIRKRLNSGHLWVTRVRNSRKRSYGLFARGSRQLHQPVAGQPKAESRLRLDVEHPGVFARLENDFAVVRTESVMAGVGGRRLAGGTGGMEAAGAAHSFSAGGEAGGGGGASFLETPIAGAAGRRYSVARRRAITV